MLSKGRTASSWVIRRCCPAANGCCFPGCRGRILVTRTRQRSSFSRCGRRSGGSGACGSDPRYLPTGHLVYVQGETLFAVPFDLDDPRPLTGGPSLCSEACSEQGMGRHNIRSRTPARSSTSRRRKPARTTTGVLALVDWDGTVQRLRVPPRHYRNPRVSPNGRQLAVQILEDDGQSDVWIYDLTEQFEMRRLTQAGRNTSPIWTPNGEEVTFGSDRDGSWAIYSQRADGRSIAERLATAEENTLYLPESWSADGTTLAFAAADDIGRTWGSPPAARGACGATRAIRVMSSSSSPTSRPAGEYRARASRPNGSWIAYSSQVRSGGRVFGTRLEPYPRTGVWHQLIEEDWIWPAWSPADGTKLLLRQNPARGSAARAAPRSSSSRWTEAGRRYAGAARCRYPTP